MSFQPFEKYFIEIIETIVAIALYAGIQFFLSRMIRRMALRFEYQRPRVRIIRRMVNLILFFLLVGIVLFIWGVERSELAFFISSLLTVLGIAFFAQWSILSNITSTLIIYFNHPAKIGDRISVYDKEYPIEGIISDIGAFFVIIKTENGERISIPNNVFIQKMVRKRDPEEIRNGEKVEESDENAASAEETTPPNQ